MSVIGTDKRRLHMLAREMRAADWLKRGIPEQTLSQWTTVRSTTYDEVEKNNRNSISY